MSPRPAIPSGPDHLEERLARLEDMTSRLLALSFQSNHRLSQLETLAKLDVPPSEELLTVKQAAAYACFSTSTIWKWRARGLIVSIKMGGRVLINFRSLKTYLDK